MKLKIKPSYEVPKRNFPNYITNDQFVPLRTSVNVKSQSLGKVIIFSDNPELLRKMNEKKKKIYTSLNSRGGSQHLHEKRSTDFEENKAIIRNTQEGDENKDQIQFPNENIGVNRDFKSRKITQYSLKRNLYLPKINNLLKTVQPRYEREVCYKRKLMQTTQDEQSKKGNHFIQIELNL